MLDLPYGASRVFGTPLMIARAKLEVILGALAPRLAGSALERIDPQADAEPQTAITAERIAVVPVAGTLVCRTGYLAAASGLVSYADIGDAIASAMDDPSVRGVILDVDSPGGEVGGLFDLVEQVPPAVSLNVGIAPCALTACSLQVKWRRRTKCQRDGFSQLRRRPTNSRNSHALDVTLGGGAVAEQADRNPQLVSERERIGDARGVRSLRSDRDAVGESRTTSSSRMALAMPTETASWPSETA